MWHLPRDKKVHTKCLFQFSSFHFWPQNCSRKLNFRDFAIFMIFEKINYFSHAKPMYIRVEKNSLSFSLHKNVFCFCLKCFFHFYPWISFWQILFEKFSLTLSSSGTCKIRRLPFHGKGSHWLQILTKKFHSKGFIQLPNGPDTISCWRGSQ